MTWALTLFLATYILMIVLPRQRALIALGAAFLFVASGVLPLNLVFSAIDWNVILMIGGTMVIVHQFIQSGMPARLADLITARVPDVRWGIVALSVFAGLISAFIDNVATVLIVAPIAITMARRQNLSPVSSIIAISVASNLEGAATLVGDTTSIMLGGYANKDFLDFFWYRGRPGLFWICQVGLLAVALVLLVLFRRDRQPVKSGQVTPVTTLFPTGLLLATIALLIAVSFVPGKPAISNGLICLFMMLVGMVEAQLRPHQPGMWRQLLKNVDGATLLLLGSLFIVIAGIRQAGVIDALAELFVRFGGRSVFAMYTLIVWSSVLISAFIDNIPYVATMLPVVTGIAAALGADPNVLYFGLLAGSTLGGNLTPIGASANIVGIGILRSVGYTVKTRAFMRIGIPSTLAAVTVAYVLIWLLFGLPA
ncbi:MAG: arsenic transporter [Clostridiaceae bacterium]|nr:arsenic transporter [Clostridiaceae bacterium]